MFWCCVLSQAWESMFSFKIFDIKKRVEKKEEFVAEFFGRGARGKIQSAWYPELTWLLYDLKHLTFKPRLHERFFALDGDAIFLKIVASPAPGGGYTWRQILTKSVILSQKIQLIEFLAISSCDFSSCRITCARVATHANFAARRRRNNF